MSNETEGAGSGSPEGAGRDLREWFGDLADPKVGPKALFDHMTEDPWWEPYIDWHPGYRLSKTSTGETSGEASESAHVFRSTSDNDAVGPDADGVIRMSIAPGETRTARVQLPDLTLELQITMPL